MNSYFCILHTPPTITFFVAMFIFASRWKMMTGPWRWAICLSLCPVCSPALSSAWISGFSWTTPDQPAGSTLQFCWGWTRILIKNFILKHHNTLKLKWPSGFSSFSVSLDVFVNSCCVIGVVVEWRSYPHHTCVSIAGRRGYWIRGVSWNKSVPHFETSRSNQSRQRLCIWGELL